MSVRSKRLAYGNAGPTAAVVYTCPPGRTAIVKRLAVSFASVGVNQNVQLTIGNTPGPNSPIVRIVGGYPNTFDVETWHVLGPGQVLFMQADLANTKFYISGTELLGVAT